MASDEQSKTTQASTPSKAAEPQAEKASKENVSGDTQAQPKEPAPALTAPAKTSAPKETIPQPKTAKRWPIALSLILNIVALTAIGALVWYGQLLIDTQKQLTAAQQQSVNQVSQGIVNVSSQTTQLQNALSEQMSRAEQQRQQFAAMTERVKELSLSQPNYWLAAEAFYLVQLAERRLLIEQDASTAIQLLLDANQRLAAMNEPSVFKIREAISTDVANLYASVTPDSDSAYLALSGLISELDNLPLNAFYIPEPQTEASQPTANDDINNWQDNLLASLKRFTGFFISVKHREHAVEPQIPVDQQWYIHANIRTQLLMAQQGVLRHNDAVYQDAIDKSRQWIKQYFDPESDKVTAVLSTLTSLANQPQQLNLPTELASQALLSNYLSQQLNLRVSQYD